MNRKNRRAYAKRLGIKMPRGVQDSSKPTHKAVFEKITTKSQAGVKYTHYKQRLQKIGGSLTERIFSK